MFLSIYHYTTENFGRFEKIYKRNLDTFLVSNGNNISGNEKTRIVLAKLLLKNS
ncbi:hypothetical protein [Thermosipho sp. 1074]|uniref:hypothetical protein n=1 Tax=Thermosipho sp. 1074 TaxID=1643331 RepID=UPI0013011C55|nr:hypothetical protein [Thermosipho sp. 1074]